ncbi:50S ribosomal protein L31 [Candidatus Roizmanbacteria bacterium CG10_big_fil_rev_8_21_14_0_10_45_7]|uniref:Large ribosomal subunit protein bL31 n=1 Tax=Candidatus Roizmanbacteria bacterium CG10_big_fil_rev_8_21_14_0_10_45_7 TaxID=1974854 RepID=A0A2M8KVP4_9BACT|nr:MAG: 50S ribosomal protein L31 [Candidatus Roizmanbacteria bacterium CG10_big_fil_rev_8_21_14_0_10_45_7]
MKATIHPKYYPQATVTCGCGNTFTVGSTREKINVEICSKCHPLYTGETRLVDTMGQVEKFKKRSDLAAQTAWKKKERIQKQRKSEKSLRDLLSGM